LKSQFGGLEELSLTVDMSTDMLQVLWQGINNQHQPSSANNNNALLSKLDLSQCNFRAGDAITALCQGLQQNKSIQTLSLENCRLRDDEVADLVRALQHHPTLQDISLRMNYAEGASMEAIADLLGSTPALQRLDLAQQNPGVLDLASFAPALQENKTLVSLNLQENYLYDAHMPAVAQALAHNRTLNELNLENCELGDTSLAVLVEHLGDFRGLTHLWLQENRFRKPLDEQLLLRGLHRNHWLQVLDLEEDDAKKLMTPVTAKRLLYLNRGGRQLLGPNKVPLSLWPTLLARVNRSFCVGMDSRRCSMGGSSSSTLQYHGAKETAVSAETQPLGKDYAMKAAPDILYYLLHGPALLER
jgi:hypothetical protein